MARGGDRNTELRLIENERERAVTLSKRRNGLFKKANELATLCGVEIAILLFSISGKPISFGSPSVHYVVNKYLNSDQVDQKPDDTNCYHESTNPELIKELNEVMEKLANVKKEGQMLDEIKKRKNGRKPVTEYVDTLGLDELEQFQSVFEELKCMYEAAIKDLSSNDEHDVDLSKIGGPKDHLKM